jgi:hypothetical protein
MPDDRDNDDLGGRDAIRSEKRIPLFPVTR